MGDSVSFIYPFMNKIVLVTGGARSGKSRFALSLGEAFSKKAYVATAQALDREMAERIAKHREGRDPAYVTFEVPIELPQFLRSSAHSFPFVLVDCLTLWLANLLQGEKSGSVENEIEDFLTGLEASSTLVLVSNEVGMGVVPSSDLGRRFRDLQGLLNQQVGDRAHEVYFMVAGLPLVLKKKEGIYESV